MFVIDKLVTNNFGILKGRQEIDLRDKDIIGIRAEYEEDKTRSNRGGKSTIPEAIRYVIDGTTRARKEIQLIHNGEDVMWVELHLRNTDDDSVRVIKRGRDAKNNGLLNIDWIEKTRDAQEEINDLLQISKDDFSLTNFFMQSDIHGFMDMSPAEKGEKLMKWVTKDHWREKEARVKGDRDNVKGKLNENEATRSALSASLEMTENLAVELAAETKGRDEVASELALTKSKRSKLFSKYSVIKERISAANTEIKKVEDALDSAIDDVAELNENKKRLTALKERLDKMKADSKPIDEKKYSDAVEARAYVSVQRTNKKTVLNNMKAQKGNTCPVLKISCESLKISPEEIKSEAEELASLEVSFAKVEAVVKAMEDQREAHSRYKDLKTKTENLEKVILASTAESRVIELNTQLEALNKQSREDLQPMIEEIKSMDKFIREKEEIVSAADTKIGQLKYRITSAEAALAKIDAVSARSEMLRAEIEELNYLAFMFGKNGIPASEIEYAFKDVEDNINYILDNMGCGFNIAFSPDKELDKWEPACHCGFVYPKGYRKTECESCGSARAKQRKNEISFDIIENGNESKFELDSGGGKTILSFAVRIAITMLKRSQDKSRLDVLFLDEVDSALDPFFVKQIIDAITNVLTKKLGFKQVIMVSHKEKVRDVVPHQILVTRKSGGYSTMRFV